MANGFRFEDWFRAFKKDLETGRRRRSTWPPSTRHLVLEALSDSAAEQFLNPIVASHLRHYGRKATRNSAGKTFWVRSEWDKFDLCYGLARPFIVPDKDNWSAAWLSGKAGYRGQCEVKVCYAHLAKDYTRKMRELSDQLSNHRDQDLTECKGRMAKADVKKAQYHGLVWLFEHWGNQDLEARGEKILESAKNFGLEVVTGFELLGKTEPLGHIWPTKKTTTYQCRMALALVKLC